VSVSIINSHTLERRSHVKDSCPSLSIVLFFVERKQVNASN